MTFLAGMVDCFEDLARFIKAFIAFILATAATGLAFQAKHEVNLMMRQVTRHTGIVALFSNIFTISFAFMYIINIGVMLYTCVGMGCFRYYIFRETAGESFKCRLLQCILGPCCATYQQLLVWLSLIFQIAVSYVYILFALMLKMLLFICQSGNSVVNSLQGFLDTFQSRQGYQAGTFSPMNWFMNLDVERYCDACVGLDRAALQCFTGCLLSVVTQVLMLMIISEEKGRIEGTMAEGVQGGIMSTVEGKASKKQSNSKKSKRRSRSESSSSGSSSSDDSPKTNPLLHSKQANVPTAGGRNYKLPGGSSAASGSVRQWR